MTRIFYTFLSKENDNRLFQEYLSGFSNTFKHKILKLRRWEDAQLSLLGRLLLNYGFYNFNEPFSEKDLSYTKYKKPFLKDNKMRFNISHSGDIVICAITDMAEIGIDIETMKEVEIRDFKTEMSDREWRTVYFSNVKNDAFFNYWTRKEAVIKAQGMGFLIPLKSFEIVDNHTLIDDEDFFLKELGLNGNYKCHLAFKGKADDCVLEPEKVMF